MKVFLWFIPLPIVIAVVGHLVIDTKKEKTTSSPAAVRIRQIESPPHEGECLREVRRQAPTVQGGLSEDGIVGLAEACIRLMRFQDEQPRRGIR